jgi:hypothetical protein
LVIKKNYHGDTEDIERNREKNFESVKIQCVKSEVKFFYL